MCLQRKARKAVERRWPVYELTRILTHWALTDKDGLHPRFFVILFFLSLLSGLGRTGIVCTLSMGSCRVGGGGGRKYLWVCVCVCVCHLSRPQLPACLPRLLSSSSSSSSPPPPAPPPPPPSPSPPSPPSHPPPPDWWLLCAVGYQQYAEQARFAHTFRMLCSYNLCSPVQPYPENTGFATFADQCQGVGALRN
jgi:hypothetical protein